MLNTDIIKSKEEVTDEFKFDPRQTDYYFNAGKYLGYLEEKKDMSLGIYEPNENGNEIFFGGIDNSEIKTINISLLLHGNTSQRETQERALELFQVLEENLYGFDFDNWAIYRLYTVENRPVYVGMDKRGIHEYVINVQIIYKI